MLLDTDVILLVSMLKKARLAAEWGKQTRHLCPSITRVETFLSEFKLEVEQTCRVLEFLGLARISHTIFTRSKSFARRLDSRFRNVLARGAGGRERSWDSIGAAGCSKQLISVGLG